MNRCPHCCRPALLAFLGGVLSLLPPTGLAQTGVREFPPSALRGDLVVTAPPEVVLDGKPDRLSPGARIRSPSNMYLLSGALVGERVVVNFTRDAMGLIHEVWVLNAQEVALKQAPSSPSRNFKFNSEIDTTPRDDGKTPFHKLPKFPLH